MSESVLVTGASGFVGRGLVTRLVEAGYEVTGVARGSRPPQLPPQVLWQPADLLNRTSVSALPRSWWAVVHLAAHSIPQTLRSATDSLPNVAMTLELLDHVEPCRFLLISSCHVYAPGAGLRSEESPTHPQGPYGMSKLLCEQAALAHADHLDVRIARPFNHLGPGMPRTLAVPSLIRRLISEQESNAPVKMLGRNSTRDFIDLEDVISAYLSIIQADAPAARIFNVCTGTPRTIAEVTNTILTLVGSTRTVEFENARLSGDDTEVLVGDPGRLAQATGWRPRRSLEESLATMLSEFGIPPIREHSGPRIA